MSLWEYSIREPPDLPGFGGNGGQSASIIENAGDYQQSRSPVTHYSSPHTNNRHIHFGNDLTGRRSRAGQTQSQSSLRRYPCPISSCSRNRTHSKRVLRSDNLGDHLRKVHRVAIPARTRIMSWIRTNEPLLRRVDEREMQVLHGGSLQLDDEEVYEY